MIAMTLTQAYEEENKPPGILSPVLGEAKLNEAPQMTLKCIEKGHEKEVTLDIFYDCLFMHTKSSVFCLNFDRDIIFGYDQLQELIWFEHKETKNRAIFSTINALEFESFLEIIKRKCPQQNFSEKFTLKEEKGHSKNSKVHITERKKDGLIFAAKIQKDSSKVEQEISILKLLKHPNLIYLRQYFIEPEGIAYIVMDYENGGNLLERVKSEVFENYKQKLKVVIDMLNSLEFLRLKGIVHRDIKPENILYSEKDGNYKIADFGMALMAGEKINKISGTPGYMAPQLFESKCQLVQVNILSDIYSMGLTFFEIFTKKQYFDGQNQEEILKNNLKAISFRKRSYPNQDNSEIEKKLLEKMIRKKPEDRKSSLDIMKSTTYSKLNKLYGLELLSGNSSQKKPKSSDTDEQNFMQAFKKLLRIKTA